MVPAFILIARECVLVILSSKAIHPQPSSTHRYLVERTLGFVGFLSSVGTVWHSPCTLKCVYHSSYARKCEAEKLLVIMNGLAQTIYNKAKLFVAWISLF